MRAAAVVADKKTPAENTVTNSPRRASGRSLDPGPHQFLSVRRLGFARASASPTVP